ncbi:F-box protein SKIP19-like [Raphanus sativus]|uniref:F-box protein SKIP19-like n=1 Tax=Raphanus sativus TaxID=3726 RepID=A0A9W3CHA0_RAPSA|nr:F-box protein SKIP19-like [Raphanus sativus]
MVLEIFFLVSHRSHSSNLRSLKLAKCSPVTSEGLTEALVKLPLLEELEVSYCSLSVESLRVIGHSLPNLKTLKLNRLYTPFPFMDDDDALAISETMPRLSHLQLFANKLTDAGLNAILDNCPDLEHLDLRQCSESIQVFRRPCDSTDDYPHYVTIIPTDSSDDDDPYPYAYDHDSDYSYEDYDLYDYDSVYDF